MACHSFPWLNETSVRGSVVSNSSLCNPMDYSPPGSSVHGILQARRLEWVAIPFSRGSSWPRDWSQVSCSARFYPVWATRDAAEIKMNSYRTYNLRFTSLLAVANNPIAGSSSSFFAHQGFLIHFDEFNWQWCCYKYQITLHVIVCFIMTECHH